MCIPNSKMTEYQDSVQPTMVHVCFAESCQLNSGGECAMKYVEMSADGRCVSFEKRTNDSLRLYLIKRGLSNKEIEQIIAENSKNAD